MSGIAEYRRRVQARHRPVVAVATARGVRLLWSPSGSSGELAPELLAQLALPSPTAQLLCERDALIMIGDYGLIYAEVKVAPQQR